jgi:hypothetical protein
MMSSTSWLVNEDRTAAPARDEWDSPNASVLYASSRPYNMHNRHFCCQQRIHEYDVWAIPQLWMMIVLKTARLSVIGRPARTDAGTLSSGGFVQ